MTERTLSKKQQTSDHALEYAKALLELTDGFSVRIILEDSEQTSEPVASELQSLMSTLKSSAVQQWLCQVILDRPEITPEAARIVTTLSSADVYSTPLVNDAVMLTTHHFNLAQLPSQ